MTKKTGISQRFFFQQTQLPKIQLDFERLRDFKICSNLVDLVGGLEHSLFSIYWEFHHPNWRTPSFFRGVGIPPTSGWSGWNPTNLSRSSLPPHIALDWSQGESEPETMVSIPWNSVDQIHLFAAEKSPWSRNPSHKKCWPWYTHQFEIADYCRLVDSGCKRCRVVIWVNFIMTSPWQFTLESWWIYHSASSPPWHPRDEFHTGFAGILQWCGLTCQGTSQLQGQKKQLLCYPAIVILERLRHCMCTVITVGRQDWSPDRAFRNRVYLLKLWAIPFFLSQ